MLTAEKECPIYSLNILKEFQQMCRNCQMDGLGDKNLNACSFYQ